MTKYFRVLEDAGYRTPFRYRVFNWFVNIIKRLWKMQ